MNLRGARNLLATVCLLGAWSLAIACEGDPPKHAVFEDGGAGGAGAGGEAGANGPVDTAGAADGGAPEGGAGPIDVIPEVGGAGGVLGAGGVPAAGGTPTEPVAGAPTEPVGGATSLAGAASVGACDSELFFNDSFFESAVRSAINLPDGPIMAADVAGLTDFKLPSLDGTVDIGGIECLTALTSIDFSDNALGTPLSLLAELPNLRSLDLGGDYLDETMISDLADITQLTSLKLHDNHIQSLEVFAELANLESLDFSQNGNFNNTPLDLSPLTGLTQLKALNLSNNVITDFSPIAELVNLTDLNLRGTQLSSLTAVAPLTKLTKLDVSYNALTNATVLGALPALQSLDVSYNQFTSLAALVSSGYIGAGDEIFAQGLDCPSLANDFAALVAKTVTLQTGC
jgi:Leucine-rich repeat (LRR) protein